QANPGVAVSQAPGRQAHQGVGHGKGQPGNQSHGGIAGTELEFDGLYHYRHDLAAEKDAGVTSDQQGQYRMTGSAGVDIGCRHGRSPGLGGTTGLGASTPPG